ncbi:MAG: NTP transferase domain-containing protein, partial [Actinomycetota bacterium]
MPDPTDVERGPVLDGAVLDGAVLDGAVLAGAVLAGGRSRRLGTDKAAVEIDGRAMADRVLDALRAVGTRPVVIGGDTP